MPNLIEQENLSSSIHSGGTMFEDLYGMAALGCTLRGQDLGFLKENAMISIGGRLLGHCILLRLPQAATAAVFTNACADAALRGADVHFAARARHTIHASRVERILCVLHRSHFLVGL